MLDEIILDMILPLGDVLFLTPVKKIELKQQLSSSSDCHQKNTTRMQYVVDNQHTAVNARKEEMRNILNTILNTNIWCSHH